jgi:RNA polymerase sigma-70 factor (ECF subfamily)
VIEAPNTDIKLSFREVVERHQRGVYKLAYQLTGNHHDAEDLAQEVFIKVHANLDAFRGDSAFGSWIHRITVNTYLNKRRKKAYFFMRLRSDFDDDALLQAPHESADRAAESGSVRKEVNRAMEKLSPKERAAFALRHYNDLSVREVAATLEVAEGTVKSLLFRAVRKLRTHLAFMSDE